MIIDDFERIASLKQQWATPSNESPQYVHHLFQNPNTDRTFKLPKVCLKSNAIEQNKQKYTFRKKIKTFHDSNDTEQFQLHSSRLENIMMMNDMTHKFEQLKQDQQSVLITKNKLTLSVHTPQKFFKPQSQDFTSELKMIQASRQKFMRCVMDTRQRNRSLQLYGEDLSPVINKEKAMQRSLVEYAIEYAQCNSQAVYSEISAWECILWIQEFESSFSEQGLKALDLRLFLHKLIQQNIFMQMQGAYDFICFCRQVVPLKQQDTGEMKEHIRRCQTYRSSSPFFQQFQNLNLDKMLFPHLRALRIEFEIFLETVDGLLMQRNHITNSMLGPINPKPQQFSSSLPNQFSISKPNIIQPNISQSLYNQSDLLITGNLKEILQKVEACEVCNQKVDADIISYFEHCFKPVCKTCIMRKIDKDSKSDFSITCPVVSCRQQMSQYELKTILGAEKFEILSTQLVERQFNIVKCAVCEFKGAFEQGAPGQVKDPITKQSLSEVHAEHYRNNRFVCVNGACKQEQCKGCKAVPYHFGHTCEEYKLKKASKCCRYCDEPIHNVQLNLPQSLQDICNQKECQEKMQLACQKMLVCGHSCPGFKNEQQCSACLNEKCCKGDQKGDDYCNICFVEGLRNAPVIRANCGHIFHYACILKRLEMRWHGPRIVFKFCYCPLCNSWLEFQLSQPQTLVTKYKGLLQDVMKKSLDRLTYENRNKDEKVSKPGEQFYNKPQEYALAIYCYYMCFKCQLPYFGGAKDCQRALEEGDKQFKPEELICANCCEVPVGETCPQHGKDYIEFKCKFCCNIAVWFCWGTTHFCEECHKKQCNGDYVSKYPREKLPKCPGKDKCPLKTDHKPNGEEQALGCAICRNARANQRNF